MNLKNISFVCIYVCLQITRLLEKEGHGFRVYVGTYICLSKRLFVFFMPGINRFVNGMRFKLGSSILKK